MNEIYYNDSYVEELDDTLWLHEELASSTDNYVSQFREQLDDSSPTAKAIDRNASWETIARTARLEGYADFAQQLTASIQEISPEVRFGENFYLGIEAA